ncbi:hypothetical protein ISS30_04760 [bacterium]|nr:hypothetical protein [bacterium]
MWCHASQHDTKILFILCMVSTAESRHHKNLTVYRSPFTVYCRLSTVNYRLFSD